jgi:hypothetical protein
MGIETFDSNDFESAKRLPKLSNITRRGSQNIAVQSHSLQVHSLQQQRILGNSKDNYLSKQDKTVKSSKYVLS